MDNLIALDRQLANPAPLTNAELARITLDALDRGLSELIIARIEQAIAQGADEAILYQILGLARRELLDGAGAMAAFEQAARRAPYDVKISQGLACTTWEAGRVAVARYEAALKLTPTDSGTLLGHASALVAAGRGIEAEAAVRRLLIEHPGWYDGHAAYARIVGAARLNVDPAGTVAAALMDHPADPALWRLLLRLLIDSRRYAEAVGVARRAEGQLGDDPEWRRAEAIALSEQGDAEAAQRLFDFLPYATAAAALVHPIRNLIRLGRLGEALALAERPFDMPEESVLWPYRALLWRVLGDARWEWLEGDERLIGSYDLGLSDQQLSDLRGVLGRLHGGSGEMLEQSVRGGTQTDGNLLARAEPAIQALKAALLDAVATHIAQLPPPLAGHPTLIGRRRPVRIAGSWSVRLTSAGFHVDHVHPQGWLSSACYIALPEAKGTEGWLAFGEARDLLPDLDGFRLIEPKVGRLVLFPATMWHGTRPFAAGERMTVAFDVAHPV
jgi:Flp pilus assembly protein TadD